MKTISYLTCTLLLMAAGCSEPGKEVRDQPPLSGEFEFTETITPENAVSQAPDTANQDLYAFMQIVIAEQRLDLSYGLQLEAEPDCHVSGPDETFLKTLLIQPKKAEEPAVVIDDSGTYRVTSAMVISYDPTCLTKKDISEMLGQKKKYAGFHWNSARLGFTDPENRRNWYCFSVPLRTKTKAILMIRKLCPGLCGTGETLLFEKKGRRWISRTVGSIWIH
jgi:hypothetical protein